MKRIHMVALIASAAFVPATSWAQAAPAAPASASATVAVGATVYDTAGAVVGTIDSTDGTNAVINTGTVKAGVPVTSLGAGAKGPVLAMTKAQLDAAAGQQQAQASAEFKSKLVAGAAVYDPAGTQLGTIKSVDATGVTLTTTSGDAKLPATGFGPGPKGVMVGLTADQLKAALSASAPATAPSTPGTTPEASTTPPGATGTTTPPKKPRS